jgi:Spy/CpxP family protein refolding chaperone
MLGFIFGTVCLIGLIKVLRRGRGWHGRWGHGGYGGYGHRGYGGPAGFGGGPRRWFLRSFFERLETTPGQEKAIVAALDELRENRRIVRDEAQQTRADLARAVAGGLIDDATLEETFARHDRLLAQLRVSFVEALKKATEALDERQRKQVGDMLEGGRFGGTIWA